MSAPADVAKLRQRQAWGAFQPGLPLVSISHDDWCAIDVAPLGPCDCEPDIEVWLVLPGDSRN